MIRIAWTAAAQADLSRIDDFFAGKDPDFADRVSAAAIAAGRFLAEWPDAGEQIGLLARKWRVKGTPYLLIYRRVGGSRLEILRVRHVRENWRPR